MHTSIRINAYICKNTYTLVNTDSQLKIVESTVSMCSTELKTSSSIKACKSNVIFLLCYVDLTTLKKNEKVKLHEQEIKIR